MFGMKKGYFLKSLEKLLKECSRILIISESHFFADGNYFNDFSYTSTDWKNILDDRKIWM